MTLMIATPPVTWTSHPQTAAFLLRWQSATSLRTCPCVSPVFPRCASKGSNERTQKHMRAHAHAIASKPARTRPMRGFAATRSASTRERMCARTYIRIHTCAHTHIWAQGGAGRRRRRGQPAAAAPAAVSAALAQRPGGGGGGWCRQPELCRCVGRAVTARVGLLWTVTYHVTKMAKMAEKSSLYEQTLRFRSNLLNFNLSILYAKI